MDINCWENVCFFMSMIGIPKEMNHCHLSKQDTMTLKKQENKNHPACRIPRAKQICNIKFDRCKVNIFTYQAEEMFKNVIKTLLCLSRCVFHARQPFYT